MERGLGQNILFIQSGLRTKVKYTFFKLDSQCQLKKMLAYNLQDKSLSSKLLSLPHNLTTSKSFSAG